MASGKPICANYNLGEFNLIEDNNVGICKKYDDLNEYCDDIENKIISDKDKYSKLCDNALNASIEFSFDELTDKLIDIIDYLIK